MSRKHPQNGPSLNKATYKPKPPTDEELAQRRAKERAREAEITEKARDSREFAKKVKATGGSIPLRGPAADAFWRSSITPKKEKNSN